MKLPEGFELLGRNDEALFEPEACRFLADLVRTFSARVGELLRQRRRARALYDAGVLPDFRPETAALRSADWKVAPLPDDLADRRVEITGPADRKMIINALCSGANVFMADFEDSLSPSWANVL